MDNEDQTFHQYARAYLGFTEQEWEKLVPSLAYRTYPKGKLLLRQGDISRYFFFVESGLLRMYSLDADVKEHIIQFAPEQWFMGDRNATYCRLGAEYYIDALEESRVLLLDKELLDRMKTIAPQFATANEGLLQKHIQHLQHRINMLLCASAEARYLQFIDLYPNLTLRVPQWMIASYLGMTPESLSRVRRKMAENHPQKR